MQVEGYVYTLQLIIIKVMTMHPTAFPNLFTGLHICCGSLHFFNAFHFLFKWSSTILVLV